MIRDSLVYISIFHRGNFSLFLSAMYTRDSFDQILVRSLSTEDVGYPARMLTMDM